MSSQIFQGCQQQRRNTCSMNSCFYELIHYNQLKSPIISHIFQKFLFFFFLHKFCHNHNSSLYKWRGYRDTYVYVKGIRLIQHMLQARWSWTRFTLEDLQPHQPRMEMHHSPDNLSSIHTLPFNSAFRHSHIIMHPAGKSEDCDVSETIPMSMLPLGKWNWTSFTRHPLQESDMKIFSLKDWRFKAITISKKFTEAIEK